MKDAYDEKFEHFDKIIPGFLQMRLRKILQHHAEQFEKNAQRDVFGFLIIDHLNIASKKKGFFFFLIFEENITFQKVPRFAVKLLV